MAPRLFKTDEVLRKELSGASTHKLGALEALALARSRTKPAIRYVADFVYVEKGAEVIEDVKGVLTPEFKIKRHLMKALLGMDVRIVK